MEGLLHGWTIEIHRMDEMALFASKMLSVDRKQGVLHRQSRSKKAYCWFVVAEGGSASHDGGFTSSFR